MTEAEMAAVSKMLMDAVASMNKSPRRTFRSKGKSKFVRSTPELKASRMAANDAECIKVFTAAGYKDIQPRINVKVYGREKPDGTITGWKGVGRLVKPGEHGLKVGPFSLFHIDQTEVVGAVEVEAPKAEATEGESNSAFHWNE